MRYLDSMLEGEKTVAVAGHIRPDGDCAGSTLAAYNYIKTYYPKIHVTLYLESIPDKFLFLKRSEEIVHDCKKETVYDLFIAMDCGDEGRLGDAVKYFRTAKKTLCIDHHISNESFADENYIFPQASSTSELIFGLLPKQRITKDIAECIYLGIVHDTGVFQYSCTSAKTMRIAGELMELGIDYTKIVDETFYTKTFEQNKIMGQALLKAELYLGGKVIVSVITRDDMKKFHALPKHLDGIVNQLRVTKGVEVAVFLYENTDGTYKASTRSNCEVDLAEIAVAFGGGGHKKAAGFSIKGTPEEMTAKIVSEIEIRLSQSHRL